MEINDDFILEKLEDYRKKIFENKRNQAINNITKDSAARTMQDLVRQRTKKTNLESRRDELEATSRRHLAQLEEELAQRAAELEEQASNLRQRTENITIEENRTDAELHALGIELNALQQKAGSAEEKLRHQLENQQRSLQEVEEQTASEKSRLAKEQDRLTRELEEFRRRSKAELDETRRMLQEEQQQIVKELEAIRAQQEALQRSALAQREELSAQDASESEYQHSVLAQREAEIQAQNAELEHKFTQLTDMESHLSNQGRAFQQRREELEQDLHKLERLHNEDERRLTSAIKAAMNGVGGISERHREVKHLKKAFDKNRKQRNDRYKKHSADKQALYNKQMRIRDYRYTMDTDKYRNLKEKLISIMKTNPDTVGLIGFRTIIDIMKTDPREIDEEDETDDNCAKKIKELEQALEEARRLAREASERPEVSGRPGVPEVSGVSGVSGRPEVSEEDRVVAERKARIDKLKADLDEDMTPKLDSIRTHLEKELISSENREKEKAYKLIVNGIKKELPNEHCSGPFSVKIYEYKNEEKIKASLDMCVLKLTEHSNIQFSIDETRTQFHLTSEYIIVTFYVNYEFSDMGLEVGVVLQSNNEPEETPKETLTNKDIQTIKEQIKHIDLNDKLTVEDLVSKHIDELYEKIKKSRNLIEKNFRNHIETQIIRAKVDKIEPNIDFNEHLNVEALVSLHIEELTNKINKPRGLIINKFKNYIETRIRNKALPGEAAAITA
jgi:hypothetical protein